MNDPAEIEARKWAFCQTTESSVAARVLAAEPLADWLLGKARAVEAFPRETESDAPAGVEAAVMATSAGLAR